MHSSRGSLACSNGGKFHEAHRVEVVPLAASGLSGLNCLSVLRNVTDRRNLGVGHPTREDSEVGVPWFGAMEDR